MGKSQLLGLRAGQDWSGPVRAVSGGSLEWFICECRLCHIWNLTIALTKLDVDSPKFEKPSVTPLLFTW